MKVFVTGAAASDGVIHLRNRAGMQTGGVNYRRARPGSDTPPRSGCAPRARDPALPREAALR